jgi:hypothetical protein
MILFELNSEIINRISLLILSKPNQKLFGDMGLFFYYFGNDLNKVYLFSSIVKIDDLIC